MSQFKFFRTPVDFEHKVLIQKTPYYSMRTGYITIASRYNKDSHVLEYGVSYCSPFDTYDKVTGDRIAIERLLNGNNYNSGEIRILPKKLNNNFVNLKILSDIFSRGIEPSWATATLVDIIYEVSAKTIVGYYD